MSGWSSPFAKWVVAGWAAHSKAVNGPEVAARLRKNIIGGSLVHSGVAATKARSSAASTSATASEPVAAAKKATAKPAVAKKAAAKRTATKATGTAGPSACG
jgi:hypothetical protein